MPSKPVNPRRKFGARFRRVYSNWFGLRGIEARSVKKGRRLDRLAYAKKEPYYRVSTGVNEYSDLFETNFYVEAQKQIDQKGKARVLEISAGEGKFLHDLKKMFGYKVETVATGLTRPPVLKGIDSYRVVRLANEKTPQKLGKFDLIVSVSGEPHMLNAALVADRLRTLLNPNGKAFLDMGMLLLGHGRIPEFEEEAIRDFEKNGFNVKVHHSPAEVHQALHFPEPLTLFELEFRNSQRVKRRS